MITPEEAVDAINERFGSHHKRSLHAKGTLCRGTFTATAEAARLTRAAHMQGQPVEVTARVSNGAGDPASRDWQPDVRGLGVKFALPDGSETDISSQTVPHFPVRTPDEFIALLAAGKPGLVGPLKMLSFVVTHPRVLPALRADAASLKPPPSYASCRYYGVHAFKWVGADGRERWVRYRWLPEREEPRLSVRDARERGDDFLQREILERMESGGARYALELQLAADGDPIDDPSALWPDERETVVAGTLELTGPATRDEPVVFDPMNLTDGIEPSGDPVLNFRPAAYSVSVERRTG